METLKSIDDYKALKPVKADHRLFYGQHTEQFADLYLPQCQQQTASLHPVIILLHGGCWRAQFGLSQLGQLCKALTGLGFAVWNLEYRRLGNGGGWPTTLEDVSRGADFLREIAVNYSLALDQLTAMGHSAGGHLALWLAGRENLPLQSHLCNKHPIKIHRIVSLAGIPNLETGVAQNICRGACEELVGGLPMDIPEIYQQASPHNLTPINTPQFHLVGEHDPVVPVSYLKAHIETLSNQNPVKFVIIPNIGHFEMVMPESPAWTHIKNSLVTDINVDHAHEQ